MSGRLVATVNAVDSGGSGSCNTPPRVLGAAIGGEPVRVFAGKKVVVKNGDTFSPAPGTTPKGDPCTSTRTLLAIRKVFVSKKGIGVLQDVLNSSTNITIAKDAGQHKVFAV